MKKFKRNVYIAPKLSVQKIKGTLLLRNTDPSSFSDLLSMCVPSECGRACTSQGGICSGGCCN